MPQAHPPPRHISACDEGETTYTFESRELFSAILLSRSRRQHKNMIKGRKKHITFCNINILVPTQNPLLFWAPRKIYVPYILAKNARKGPTWERTQKRDPLKLFRGNFRGRKWGPKRAIFGHEKVSLLFFSCPSNFAGKKKKTIFSGVISGVAPANQTKERAKTKSS